MERKGAVRDCRRPLDTSLPHRFFNGQDALKGPLPADLVVPSYRAEPVGFPPLDAAVHADFGRAFYAGFPDLCHTIDEMIEAPPCVITRFTLRGTHTALFMVHSTDRARVHGVGHRDPHR